MMAIELEIKGCKVCESTSLTWHTTIINRSGVQQGRLKTTDVECIFFLGCDSCSETLVSISADKAAGIMNDKASLSLAP